MVSLSMLMARLFQSTLPVGGATQAQGVKPWTESFQSTLPVGGATKVIFDRDVLINISIHAPRGGSDRKADNRR